MTPKKAKPTSRPARRPAFAFDVLTESTALLALAAPPAPTPAPRVKAQLLARIRAAARPAPAAPPGWRFDSMHAAEGWRESFPGVRFKSLSVDAARDVVLLLIEMAPGARFPDHVHDTSSDEGILISGEVMMGGRALRAGDYYHADVGTKHVSISSPGGCTALLSVRTAAWKKWRAHAAAR